MIIALFYTFRQIHFSLGSMRSKKNHLHRGIQTEPTFVYLLIDFELIFKYLCKIQISYLPRRSLLFQIVDTSLWQHKRHQTWYKSIRMVYFLDTSSCCQLLCSLQTVRCYSRMHILQRVVEEWRSTRTMQFCGCMNEGKFEIFVRQTEYLIILPTRVHLLFFLLCLRVTWNPS